MDKARNNNMTPLPKTNLAKPLRSSAPSNSCMNMSISTPNTIPRTAPATAPCHTAKPRAHAHTEEARTTTPPYTGTLMRVESRKTVMLFPSRVVSCNWTSDIERLRPTVRCVHPVSRRYAPKREPRPANGTTAFFHRILSQLRLCNLLPMPPGRKATKARGLAFLIIPPGDDGAACLHPAGVILPGADGSEGHGGSVGIRPGTHQRGGVCGRWRLCCRRLRSWRLIGTGAPVWCGLPALPPGCCPLWCKSRPRRRSGQQSGRT